MPLSGQWVLTGSTVSVRQALSPQRPRRWDEVLQEQSPASHHENLGREQFPHQMVEPAGTQKPICASLTDHPPSNTSTVWAGPRGQLGSVLARPGACLSVTHGVNDHLHVSMSQAHEGHRRSSRDVTEQTIWANTLVHNSVDQDIPRD